MPSLGSLHPIVVHFVIALGVLGIVFRLASHLKPFAWASPAARVLLITAAVAAVLAAQSGTAAHGLAERIPGVRSAVQEHEEAGEWARNIFVVVGLLELAAFAVRSRAKLERGLLIASSIGGITAGLAVYRAGDLGGELVYSYAGGVGTRTGDTTDVRRLLIAGLYHQARLAREAGRSDESARLIEELARQAPDDPSVKLLSAESLLKDRKDPAGALAAVAAIQGAPDDRFLTIRKGMLASDAWVAAGQKDSARAILTSLARQFPQARMIGDALKRLE
ncbi:MAG TPA: DUF2231 domain-containing protein [Gemmatimonadales bacterium]|nr:DUF2231 domain-containing protein [Gemmatimonadales bacterium]